MSTHTDTTPLAQQYAQFAAGFSAVLEQAPAHTWAAASPCAGWTGRDVVAHVIDTQRDFLGRHQIELAPPVTLDDPPAAWRAHTDAVAAALADPAVADHRFDGHFGPTTIGETLVRFYGFDMIAHRWDVAVAAGIDLRFADDELTLMETGADGFGDALYSDGVCERLDAPADADRQARLLARLGRRA